MIGSTGDTEKKKEAIAKPEDKVIVVKAEEAKSKEVAPVAQKATEKKVPVINGAANKKANNNITTTTNNNSNGVNGVPKTKPTPANNPNNKLKPVKVIPPKAATVAAAAATKHKGEIPKIVEPDKEAQKEVTPGEGSTSFFDGENWKVTISSKHELATSSDLPHRTVTIMPKTPPPEVKKAAAVKQQVGVRNYSRFFLALF